MKIFDKTPFLKDPADEPFITEYLESGKNNPCVVVCPGGGYSCLADHERYVELFRSYGLSVFVLNYRCAPYHYPCQMLDITRAIKFVKFNSDKFGIDPEKVLVAGSSAGGHLALSASCYPDEGHSDGDEIDKLSSSVAGTVLCYPVVSLTEYSHSGTNDNFADGNKELAEKFSIQKTAHKGMAPIFAWHTMTDGAVDVRNVLMLAEKCHEQGIDFELHLFSEGHHGLGVAADNKNVHQWTALLKNWLETKGFIGKDN